jgi:tetratricopeptide (TPR) repeat protein
MYASRYNDEIDVVAALLPVNARLDLSVDGDRSVLAAVWEENAVAETASESRLVPMVLPDVPPELLDGLQREYQEWLNLEPGRQEAQYGRLRDDALSIAARYPGTYPAIQSILINADALARLERWTDAQSVYEQAAEIAAGSDLEWTALYGAAVSAESAGEIAAARSFYEVLVRRDALQNPLAARAYFSIGRISESLGDIDQALSAYQTVRELFPDDSWSSFAMTRIIAIRVANQDR